MIGITGYSVYVPRYRVRREMIAAAWGARAVPGCKAVMHFDEDALTMGQAAAWRAPSSGARPDALYFASTTAPYWQRSAASLIAASCDLAPEVATADFAGSLRAGTSALRAAIRGGGNTLVVAADAREGAPESAEELAFGDAAAAIAVGSENVLAEVLDIASRSGDFLDEWRRDTDVHVRSFASKYSTTRGYEANMVAVGRALLSRAPALVARAALVSPDGRAQLGVAKALGVPPDRVEDTRAADLGITGAAMPLLLLAQALDHSQPGDLILAIGYGDGADGFLLRALAPGSGSLFEDARPPIEYPTYALYRKLREFLRTPSGAPEVSNVLLHREESQNVRLHGTFCPRCGTMNFPISKVCGSCRHADGLVEKPLARAGRVFTFTKDFLYDAPVQPTVMAVVDLEGGGRFLCQMTDADPGQVEIGMPVELTLRRMKERAGAHHYYWKCRPV